MAAPYYTPVMFVGIGRDNHFFTLRETYMHEWYDSYKIPHYEVRSFHHFNLSQDPDEAIAKATEAAAKLGLRLNTTRESLVDEMNTIKRATAEEMAARERAQAAQQAEYEAMKQERFDRDMEVINAGFFPFGKFTGIAFEKAEQGYVQWIMAKRDEFEEGSLLRAVADKLIRDYPELAAPTLNPTTYVGNVGDRIAITVKVLRSYAFNTDFGWSYITTMADTDNNCIISKGKFNAKVGEVLSIKATIKAHDEYKGQAQTVVQRVKAVDLLPQ